MNRLAARIILRSLRELSRGRLEIRLPDGEVQAFGGPPDSGPACRIEVHDWAFFRRLLLGGETGAGASYIAGDWSCDDLVALVRLAIANTADLRAATPLAWVGAWVDRIRNRSRRNSIPLARRNIREHYDLSNEFFKLFLDPTLTYSCALFEHADQSLEEAQLAKYRAIARKADLRPGHRVLEIGCGWGAFAEFAAREYGCEVVGITLSEAQAELARRRIEWKGLADKISIELIDYREMRGHFDRIVSIEMLEAVGHENLPVFFQRVDELLAPSGTAVLQVITIPDQRYKSYRRRPDYIQRFVFPGSHLPSLGAIQAALAKGTMLTVRHVEDIALHYAETLRRWRHRFLARQAEVRALGFDASFIRRWEYYLAYCEAGFASRYIQDLQIVLGRTPEFADLRPTPLRTAAGTAAPRFTVAASGSGTPSSRR